MCVFVQVCKLCTVGSTGVINCCMSIQQKLTTGVNTRLVFLYLADLSDTTQSHIDFKWFKVLSSYHYNIMTKGKYAWSFVKNEIPFNNNKIVAI